eukprot:TRINITY_DN12761_c0_g2_i2.p1 TRINITY_DN12761_c0_g2~~TRINITY_DN12761_c0_g2_i2.p1  ORF type:complete len:130 (+),score=26.73 TRINITY_DN12761_c0_g2_i2:56-445(+)
MATPEVPVGSVVYVVEAVIDSDVFEAYHGWIVSHVQQILELDNGSLFQTAEVFINTEEGSIQDGKRKISVHYRAVDKKALDTYFSQHADGMRKDGLERFGSKVSYSRRVLESAFRAKATPQSTTFGYVF